VKSSTVVILVVVAGVFCCVMAACGLCVAFGFLGNYINDLDLGGSPQTGQAAPDFRLQSIDGDDVSLRNFRGQPVMVNFWAIWCDPCIEEMPLIQERYQQHAPDLVVLAVEEGDSLASVRNYVSESQFSFLVLSGTDAVSRQYNINAYPTSVFIDADGVIQSVIIGSLSGPGLDAELVKIGIGD